ncbi:MAG: hypothetical protein QOH43_680 [Solirubrobacteraceae bacterium]|nr:hypothetical protein [Solirubrobacteraceae bacterium]
MRRPVPGYARQVMSWTFLYLMLFLKLPIAGLAWIVWWAVKAEPDPEQDDHGNDDGGSKRPVHPRGPLPHRPRRGPHGDPAVPSPPRTRRTVAATRRRVTRP